MAKRGPIVRYSRHVNATAKRRETGAVISRTERAPVTAEATMPRTGSPTAVTRKPSVAGVTAVPASRPRPAGKIRLPAPKNRPKTSEASSRV